MNKLSADAIVPGGVLATDHWHVGTYDETCSRCRKPIAEDQAPLLLWGGDNGDWMLSYCEDCLGIPPAERAARHACDPDPAGERA